MALGIWEYNFASINESIQIGDWVYYVPTATQGAFDMSNGNVVLLGIVVELGSNYIHVKYESTGPSLPSATDYMMFSKNPEANVSKLSGYYMAVSFVNDSTSFAELFSVGSEMSENSK